MLPSDYTKEMWDKEFACRFTVDLADDELKTNMKVDNTGSEDSFDFQAALHSYFAVSSLENLEIAGSFEGKEFLNKMVGENGEMQTEDRSAITITEEYDRGKFFLWRNDSIINSRVEWNRIESESESELELLF
jgi:glucose-6-phosphate 1-epimerase